MSKSVEKGKTSKGIRVVRIIAFMVAIAAIAASLTLALQNAMELRAAQEQVDQLTAEVQELETQLTIEREKHLTIEPIAYQELYPDFYVEMPKQSEPKTKTVYLTFDDGPSARTDEVLDILERQEIKGTFFVVGNTDAASKQRMKDIVAEGHTLAMHAYKHNYKQIYQSVEAYLDDAYKVFTLIRETTGETPTIFRMPGGSINAYNRQTYQEIIAEMMRRGFVPYDWNVSSGDASGTAAEPEQLTSNVVNGTRKAGRAIVLMHDASKKWATVQALEPAIVQLKEAGYEFERLTPDVKPVLFGYKE